MFTPRVLSVGMAVLGCAALMIGLGACSSSQAPTVVSTDPADGATGVPVTKTIVVTFSEEMDPATISTDTFTLMKGATPVGGTVTSSGITATFKPTNDLALNTLYTAKVAAGVQALEEKSTEQMSKCEICPEDILGIAVVAAGAIVAAAAIGCDPDPENALEEEFVWTFTTRTVPQGEGEGEPGEGELAEGEIAEGELVEGEIAEGEIAEGEIAEGEGEGEGQEGIDLRSANTFAILAGSTVANTGLSNITGDLGVSPGTAVTGFPPGILNGTQYTGVASAAGQAKLDLTAAFNDAAGRSTDSVSLQGDLSGLTLYPGLYTNATSVMLSAGNVTLDAQGDANAVFIFQMGSTLTTGSGTQVILSGGAKANNIYWQVGSSATLGTTSIFKGNILAQESITLATDATLEGRALTQTAAVTLDAAVITLPAP